NSKLKPFFPRHFIAIPFNLRPSIDDPISSTIHSKHRRASTFARAQPDITDKCPHAQTHETNVRTPRHARQMSACPDTRDKCPHSQTRETNVQLVRRSPLRCRVQRGFPLNCVQI